MMNVRATGSILTVELDHDVEETLTDRGVVILLGNWIEVINGIDSIAKIDILREYETNFIQNNVKKLFGEKEVKIND